MWGAHVMIVTKTGRTVRSVGSPNYEYEEEREDSEEELEPRF